MLKAIKLKTKPNEIYDITKEVENIIKESRIISGLCNVFCQGSTAGILINENEPMSLEDLKDYFERAAPSSGIYHHAENAHSHIRASLIGCSKIIPIENSKPFLGQWQQILFCEFDTRKREREIFVKIVKE